MRDSSLLDSTLLCRELNFERSNIGEVHFIVDPKSGFNDSTSFEMCERFFDAEYIKQYAIDIYTRGGRGQTLLFTLPLDQASLLYGPKKDLNLTVSQISQERLQQHLDRGEDLLSESDNTQRFFPLCLRDYYRGGLIGKILKRGYLRFGSWANRARLEFELLQKLRALDLPVPRPLIAREVVGSLFVQNAIVIEQIPNTENLAELLQREHECFMNTNSDNSLLNYDEYEPQVLTKELSYQIGLTLAKFFAQGVFHSDLNVRNILVNQDRECFLIDFDKCELRELSGKDVNAMLSRLERSILKEITALNSQDLPSAKDKIDPDEHRKASLVAAAAKLMGPIRAAVGAGAQASIDKLEDEVNEDHRVDRSDSNL